MAAVVGLGLGWLGSSWILRWIVAAITKTAPIGLSIIVALILFRLWSDRRWRKRWEPWVRRFFAVGIISYLVAFGLIGLYQPRFLYKPVQVLQTTPESHNLTYEEVWLPANPAAEQPELLHAWWIPQPKEHLGTLIYFHGAGLNMGYNVSQANWFRRIGLDVLLIEYRGYGLSEGDFPTEAALYEDAEVALAHLTKDRGIPPEEILLYGHSLGGAIAINLASHHPVLAGVIVQNTFTSMAEMVARSNIAKWFPVQLLLNQRFESLQKVPHLKIPQLFIHATGDPRIPVEMGKRLHAAASEPKRLILVPVNSHENASAVYKSPEHLDKIKQFAIAAFQKSHEEN